MWTCKYADDWWKYPVWDDGVEGPPGAAGSEEDRDNLEPTDDEASSSTSSTNVRTNFPETWIWTEATTECVIMSPSFS